VCDKKDMTHHLTHSRQRLWMSLCQSRFFSSIQFFFQAGQRARLGHCGLFGLLQPGRFRAGLQDFNPLERS